MRLGTLGPQKRNSSMLNTVLNYLLIYSYPKEEHKLFQNGINILRKCTNAVTRIEATNTCFTCLFLQVVREKNGFLDNRFVS